MMARKFRELVQEALNPEEQATAQAESRAMLLEMNLRQIREKLSELSQEDVAQLLDVTQPYISKLERQQDMLVSKLYDYVATLGGKVEIRAKFPAYDVVVRQFDDLAQVLQVKDSRGRAPRAGRAPVSEATARKPGRTIRTGAAKARGAAKTGKASKALATGKLR
ncbi:MAG: XRE family transcriptional regulator [Deltaproteobacteria bacterium]